ncbi:PREDICTED: elongation factor Ts, mitochondrial-like, partial [Rhagoletis zephyria]|uniref:elongation factor Ts, mitochondrial-like n=1 Tax=Rhagoletis zephyria TaxID=28612 RepID=UPI000811206B
YAFALCRKALEMHQQDLAKAEKWLRAEALKQGWEKAERVKSRSTGEGLVGIYTSPDRRTAAMVEVRCETDFVARNQHFVGLVTALAERLSNFSSGAARDARDRGSCIHKRWIVDEGKLVELAGSSITEAISKLGENIRFVRGCIVHIQGEEEDQKTSTSSNQVRLLPYTHAVAGKVASANPNVILGKYGTIIAIQKQQQQSNQAVDAETEQSQVEDGLKSNSIEEVGSKLGQHIIGLTPLTVTPPPPPPPSSESASFEEATEEEITGEEEPTALLKQKFIFNDEITVEQFLANSDAAVLDFVRFECGEEGADS